MTLLTLGLMLALPGWAQPAAAEPSAQLDPHRGDRRGLPERRFS
jgi:hypothetical protein